ncbi:MAG: hypothetical protein DCC75_00160 [Proteobacteria bacterium]|nr:MAG: hypothetical protein DCC75_00160 [Pseudomonadota bacterium]
MARSEAEVRFQAFKGLLRPAIRYFLKTSHPFKDFVDIAKELFVEIAREEISKTSLKINPSRISVMTGLHRKEVKRFSAAGEPVRKQAPHVLVRVLNVWEQDSRFHSKTGRKRALTHEGENSEFKSLVECVSKDVHPGTVLFEMERMGLVRKRSGLVRLIKQYPRFHQDPSKGLDFLKRDIESLFESVEENLFNREEVPNLHIRTEFDNMVKSAVPEIRKWLLEEGAAFHKKARDFLSQSDLDLNPGIQGEGGGRVSVTAMSATYPKK